MAGRVAAIGLDAAEWTYLEPLIESGALPNLAALRARSARAQLRNNDVYRAEIAWGQFLSGRAAEKRGYWGEVRYDPATYEIYQGTAYNEPFYALGEGTKVIAFDVPQTVMADGVDGVQVAAWGAHSPQYPRTSRPVGLLDEIDDQFGCHPAAEHDYQLYWHREDFVEGLGDALERGARIRADVVAWLAERFDWDLLVTTLSEPHSGGHHFWHSTDSGHPYFDLPATRRAGESLLQVYRAVDDSLGRIIEALPDDTTVVVFAVHGMRTNESDIPSLALLPELLHRLDFGRGLLRVPGLRRWRRAGCPPVVPDSARGAETRVADAFAADRRGRVKRLLRQRLPRAIVARKRRAQLRREGWTDRTSAPVERDVDADEVAARRLTLGWQPPTWYAAHWPKTRAFALPTYSDGHVRMNVAGREGQGTVDPANFQAECDRVKAELLACRDPRTGRSVVQQVIQTRETPEQGRGPLADLIVLWEPYTNSFEHPGVGIIGPFPHLRTGEHTNNGFLFAAGPGIEPCDLAQGSSLDVPPTILSLLGRSVDGLDGEALVVRSNAVPGTG